MTELKPSSERGVILTVSDLVPETAEACSVIFEVPEVAAERFTDYRPGQFLTLRIPSDRTGSVARCYSLSSAPSVDKAPKVTVKRTAGGYGSNWVCDNLTVGSRIEVLPPSGVFTPADLDRPLLLVAAGSGITPVISILKAALDTGGAPVTLFYANRSEDEVIFAGELCALQAEFAGRLTVVHWLESLQGRPTAAAMASRFASLAADHSAYLCGPAPFMDAAADGLREAGFADRAVHRESFTSLTGDPFTDPVALDLTEADRANAATLEVELDGETTTLRWPRRQTLVDVMVDAGLDAPFSCREGECGSCACTLARGTVEMEVCEALDPEDVAEGYILGCQARPTSEDLRIVF